MKIVQSFWSNNRSLKDFSFGWIDPSSHILGWILSSNLLSKSYDNIELITDRKGYELLIQKLKLPYNNVKIVLDDLNHYPQNFWATAKFKAIEIQTTPFLHVDGDIFKWKRFPTVFEESPLVVQNLEKTTSYTRNFWKEIGLNLDYVPEELLRYHNGENLYSYNMGVFGGYDLDFLKKFTIRAWEFIEKNISNWDRLSQDSINLFFEQLLFYQMSDEANKKVTYLLPETIKDNQYSGFGDFHKVPHEKDFLHLLGDYKRDVETCRVLKNYVHNYYPDSYRLHLEFLEISKHSLYPADYDFSFEANQSIKTEVLGNLKNGNYKNASFNSKFGRDLLSIEMMASFNKLKNYGEKLILVPFSDINCDYNEKTSGLLIEEINGRKSQIDLDDLDEFILGLIAERSTLENLKESFLRSIEKIENTNQEIKVRRFIDERVQFYINRRIIACYLD